MFPWLLMPLFNIVEVRCEKIVEPRCLCCVMMFRFISKQPGIQKLLHFDVTIMIYMTDYHHLKTIDLMVRFPSMHGTFVLQQDTLSTLLLSTQVYKWVPGRM